MTELILALDVPDASTALALLDKLPDLRWVKIGALFTRVGPPIIQVLLDRGLHVFLDCKWLDIPHTVQAHVMAARDHGVHMVTVHTSGGQLMMRAAKEVGGPAVVGVTVLTSQYAWEDKVLELAHDAVEARLDGVVCGPKESKAVRALVGPYRYVVVPGVRRGDAVGDQVRTAPTAEGASHLVVGRAIIEAPDPLVAARRYGYGT